MNVAVFGLGKLGSCLAAVLGNAGHHVIGYDTQRAAVSAMSLRQARFREPGLNEMLRRPAALTATEYISQAVEQSDIGLVVVPTPSRPDGSFDTAAVRDVAEQVAAVIESSDRVKTYTLVICSTTSPGSIDRDLGHLASTRLLLGYNPMFIALGSVINDLTNPDINLIGANQPTVAQTISVLGASYQKDCPHHTMPIKAAELAKLALNCALSVKIGFANGIARVAEGLGVDPVQVLESVGADARIGPALLRPGGPPGGPCLPRDLVALRTLTGDLGVEMPITEATILEGSYHAEWICDEISSVAPGTNTKVAILGATYKARVPVADDSLALQLIAAAHRKFHWWSANLVVVDDLVDLHAHVAALPIAKQKYLHFKQVSWAEAGDADVYVIGTPGIDIPIKANNRATVINPWK